MSQCERFYFNSSNGEDEICAAVWPVRDPVAIVQICHGMAEHIMRYDDFAQHLNKQGYLVCGHDHLGHGITAEGGIHGFFAYEHGWDYLVRDVHLLRRQMRHDYPRTPYVLFGHSMGSFIARDYVPRFGKGLQAAVFCGTSGGNIAAGLAQKFTALLPAEKPGNLIDRLAFQPMNNRFKDINDSDFNWLSTDEEQVALYEDDPNCGFVFTNSGYGDLFHGLQRISSRRWAKSMPRRLPILLISGADDPVGNYGKGVEKVYDRLAAAGCNRIAIKLYKGMRHEILNEVDNHRVYNQISTWLDDVIVPEHGAGRQAVM